MKQPTLWNRFKLEVQDRFLQPRLGDIATKVSDAYRRRYFRHVFERNRIARAILEGESVTVRDLSYGGMRIERPQSLSVEKLKKRGGQVKIILDICGEAQETIMQVSSMDATTLGLSCDPTSPFSQLFLHRYLSFMDLGLSLKAVPKARVQKAYQNPDWASYGSERGPVELHFDVDQRHQYQELHAHYVNGSRYEFVLFQKDKIVIGCTPSVKLSEAEKNIILAQVLCLLLGMRQISRSERLDPYIAVASARLI